MLPVLASRLSSLPAKDFLDGFFDFGFDLSPFSDMEAWEEDGSVCVSLQIPGFEKEEIDVTREGSILRISASREQSKEQKDKKYLSRTRLTSQFLRTIELPEGTEDDKAIEAEYKNGVLTVSIPKAEAKKPKKIQVK
jgi:HSP20 family molecular chaperone IbpA